MYRYINVHIDIDIYTDIEIDTDIDIDIGSVFRGRQGSYRCRKVKERALAKTTSNGCLHLMKSATKFLRL